MKLIKIDGDTKIYPYNSLYNDNPNVSFAIPLTEDTLAHYGVFVVRETEKPECAWLHFVSEATPVFEDGEWRQKWEVLPRSTEEMNFLLESEWKNLRRERNKRLTESDWTQLPDSPVDREAWVSYRQELRDLPSRTSNPFQVNWPLKPGEELSE